MVYRKNSIAFAKRNDRIRSFPDSQSVDSCFSPLFITRCDTSLIFYRGQWMSFMPPINSSTLWVIIMRFFSSFVYSSRSSSTHHDNDFFTWRTSTGIAAIYSSLSFAGRCDSSRTNMSSNEYPCTKWESLATIFSLQVWNDWKEEFHWNWFYSSFRYTYFTRVPRYSVEEYLLDCARKHPQLPDASSWQEQFRQRAFEDQHIRYLFQEIISNRTMRKWNFSQSLFRTKNLAIF